MKFLLFGDSHVNRIRSSIIRSSDAIVLHGISGLKWIDYFDRNLSFIHLLFQPQIQSLLFHAEGLILLIGTNSVRAFNSSLIMTQISEIIFVLRYLYPQLNRSYSITISFVFPCLKPLWKNNDINLLRSKIESYNKKLYQLSSEMNFNCIDFHLKKQDLCHDNMHLNANAYRRIFFSFVMPHVNTLMNTHSSIQTTIQSSYEAKSKSSSVSSTIKSSPYRGELKKQLKRC